MSNVIWVDDKDNVLGEITRQKAHQEGLLHRVAVIFMINEKRIQKKTSLVIVLLVLIIVVLATN